MPRRRRHGLRALSLFSGGGGLDLGFERAGFDHVASFDVLEICGATLRRSRPDWQVFRGSAGDVNRVDWSRFAGAADVVHGGPPCQPFSIAGRRNGGRDERDMWPAFISAVRGIEPAAFVAENVPGLLDPKFGRYVEEVILAPLASRYHVVQFKLQATDFGVPQVRKRVVFAGFRSPEAARRHHVPSPTHGDRDDLFSRTPRTPGARAALGLPDIGFDCFAPTLRSGFTGPRKSTSVLNSKASQEVWRQLRIWPNGVQKIEERLRCSLRRMVTSECRCRIAPCCRGSPTTGFLKGPRIRYSGRLETRCARPWGMRSLRPWPLRWVSEWQSRTTYARRKCFGWPG